jgi:hypothetical protein
MPSDQLVSARDVLRAIEEVRRVGIDRLLLDWEQREPDLAEHLLEAISDLHHRVMEIAPHPKAQRRLIRQTETLILVLLTALRRALLRHWEDGETVPGRTDPPEPDTRADAKPRDSNEGSEPNGA